MKKLIHKGCGGTIKKRKCAKCGKTWGIVGSILTGSIESKEVKFDEEAYRRRIKEGKDIP